MLAKKVIGLLSDKKLVFGELVYSHPKVVFARLELLQLLQLL